MLSFQSSIAYFDNNVYGFHLPMPDEIHEAFAVFDNKRVVFVINGKVKRAGGIMKSADYYYLLLNKETIRQLGVSVGDTVSVEIEKDHSVYGMEMPEEMQVVFDQDELAFHVFKALTPGKQRNLIYLVSKVKNPESRINKSLAIAEHLNETQGQLEFKSLMETIKKYNNAGKQVKRLF